MLTAVRLPAVGRLRRHASVLELVEASFTVEDTSSLDTIKVRLHPALRVLALSRDALAVKIRIMKKLGHVSGGIALCRKLRMTIRQRPDRTQPVHMDPEYLEVRLL